MCCIVTGVKNETQYDRHPAIGSDLVGSLADFETDMLLLGRYQDGGLGPVQMFDEKTNGALSRCYAAEFTGRLGNRFTFENKNGDQRYLLVVGLGAGAILAASPSPSSSASRCTRPSRRGAPESAFPFSPVASPLA